MNKRERQSKDTNNMILAMVLSMLIVLYWQFYIEAPRMKAEEQAAKAKAQATLTHTDTQPEAPALSREQLLAQSPRVAVASPTLKGSIALKGLRFDDLTFTRYRETLAPDSPNVTLFSPADEAEGYFAEVGWSSADTALKLPTPDTVWTADGKELTPATPVTLSWKNPDGVTFTAHIALDDQYLFTVTQSALDASGKPLSLQTYAYLNQVVDITAKTAPATPHRRFHPELAIHQGPLGVFDNTLKETPYKKLTEEKEETFEAGDGWLGISDKYWLSTLIPPRENFTAHFSYYSSRGRDHFQADYLTAASPTATLHLFAGVKELQLLENYGTQYHIPLFDRAVDFGYFYWLAEPLFHLLAWFHGLVGNYGIAILLLTVVVKLCLYPLASKSFIAMNQMKALQPRMKELQERHKDDKMQLNQAIMELYKREKVNPAGGCLPIFIQIPVFISLYKVLYVSIEMRHAPFYGWVHDLSAPDPSNLFTLFGLIPWGPPAWLHLGLWPILMCATMVLQQRQSPPPADPTQAQMMKFSPLIFLFLFHEVAAGLMIYWSWSNTLSILQQWYIKRTHGGGKKK